MAESIRVLVVEDSNKKFGQVRDVCEQVLGRSSVVLVHATSASAALSQVAEVPYDMMILDLYLPKRDNEVARKEGGLELLAELQRVGRPGFYVPVHIIGLTQYEDLKAESADMFLRAGDTLLLYSDSNAEWRELLAKKLQSLYHGPTVLAFARVSETSRFDEMFRDRLSWLVEAIRSLGNDAALRRATEPPLQYLHHLDNSGAMSRLVYEAASRPAMLPGDSGAFHFSIDEGRICFSSEFKIAWLSMADELKITGAALCDSIDNFILHELFHVGQHLTTERHGDIRYAQSVLRVLDYHADANAALAAIALYKAETPGVNLGWRAMYTRVLASVLRQIYVFDFMTKPERMLPSRLVRHLTWHYHFHRVARYTGSSPLRKQPLAVEPAFSLRGSADVAKVGGYARNWPSCEPAEIARDKPHLWMAVPNQFGIPRVYRFLSTKPRSYQALFDGLFSASTELTEPFLGELFNQFGELISE